MAYTKDEQRFADALEVAAKMHEQIKASWKQGYWPSFDEMKTYSNAVDKLFIAFVVSNPYPIKRGS